MKLRYLLLATSCLLVFAWADPLWVRTYNGPYNYFDEARAIGVDDSGNVIVSGHSGVSRDDAEFVTIKYRPNGDTAWLRHFNPGSGRDGATALAVDRSGNIIITGYLGDPTSEYGDWVTIKYSAAGESLWTAVYDLGDEDQPSSIAVDSAGNSYVTGRAGWNNDYDYAVVKYDPNGNEVWVFNYNGGYEDLSQALAVDGQGNTYVTGYTQIGCGSCVLMTWKLGPGGESLWANIYGKSVGPSTMTEGAIATDNQGNVVVTCTAYDTLTFNDYLTVKYSPTGDTLWTRRYNGPNNRYDDIAGLALDAAGNVYVTGTSEVDTLSRRNYATVKYSPTGEQRWVVRYIGPRNYDDASGIALDAEANVYVTGRSASYSTGWDAVTVKYDSSGNPLWVERFDLDSSYEEGSVVALSRQGMVYVAGKTYIEGNINDYLTLAYGTAGAVTEKTRTDVRTPACSPTIIRKVLFLPEVFAVRSYTGILLLDISGRKVMELQPGVNDVRHLAPGVYFIHWTSGVVNGKTPVSKIVVTE